MARQINIIDREGGIRLEDVRMVEGPQNCQTLCITRGLRGYLRNVEVWRSPQEVLFPKRGMISCRSVKQNLGITPLSSVRPTRWTRHHSSSYSSIIRIVSPSLMDSSSLRDGT